LSDPWTKSQKQSGRLSIPCLNLKLRVECRDPTLTVSHMRPMLRARIVHLSIIPKLFGEEWDLKALGMTLLSSIEFREPVLVGRSGRCHVSYLTDWVIQWTRDHKQLHEIQSDLKWFMVNLADDSNLMPQAYTGPKIPRLVVHATDPPNLMGHLMDLCLRVSSVYHELIICYPDGRIETVHPPTQTK
jgi:hypothetical protein